MKLVILPGLGDSGPEHWQTLWEKKFSGALRVRQRDWEQPDLQSWISALATMISGEHSDLVLVAHSLGVALVAHWAQNNSTDKIRGALLVAPSDVDSPAHTPDAVRGFAPLPLTQLPFKSIVVASSNDPFVSIERARLFANRWGSEFADIGPQGHINATSGLDEWQEGQKILGRLIPAYP